MPKLTFTKADRILKRYDFKALSQEGKKIRNKYFIVLYSTNRFKSSRIGVTVTKKVGNAPVRNRIKRLIREYFRLNRHRIKGFCDINIIPKREAVKLSSNQFFSSMQNIFDEISGSMDY